MHHQCNFALEISMKTICLGHFYKKIQNNLSILYYDIRGSLGNSMFCLFSAKILHKIRIFFEIDETHSKSEILLFYAGIFCYFFAYRMIMN